jgi:membrane protein YdbS with pleckstrin-like domain
MKDICPGLIKDVPLFAKASASARIDPMESTEVGLRPPRHRVSPRARLYWAVRALTGWLVPFAVEIVWMIVDDANLGRHVAGLVATAVVAAVHVTVMPQWRYRVHRWESTPEAVYTQSGWFNQERRIAPVSRIQTVDSERGPFEQVFGLANVTVTTASAAGPIKIQGLDRDTAQRLVDELTDGTQGDAGDAT